jgi:hypothetical protein
VALASKVTFFAKCTRSYRFSHAGDQTYPSPRASPGSCPTSFRSAPASCTHSSRAFRSWGPVSCSTQRHSTCESTSLFTDCGRWVISVQPIP